MVDDDYVATALEATDDPSARIIALYVLGDTEIDDSVDDVGDLISLREHVPFGSSNRRQDARVATRR